MIELGAAIFVRYRFGPFELDRKRFLLERNAHTVTLPRISMEILLHLVENAGDVISRKELTNLIWQGADPESKAQGINTAINRIRTALYDDPARPEYIDTVIGKGYRFLAPVEIVSPPDASTSRPPEPAAAVDPEETTRDSTPLTPPSPGAALVPIDPGNQTDAPQGTDLRTSVASAQVTDHRATLVSEPSPAAGSPLSLRARLLGLAALVTFGVILMGLAYRHHSKVVRSQGEPIVAILPFRNLTQSPGDQWLSSAFRETMFTDLSSDRRLHLIAVDDVARAEQELQLKNDAVLDTASLSRLCQDLGCTQVISGAYIVIGGQVRIDGRLTDAADGKVLRTYSVSGPVENFLALLARNNEGMRQAFDISAAPPADRLAVLSTASVNREAYQAYLAGLESARSYDLRAAVDSQRRAISLEPHFAPAYLALSRELYYQGDDEQALAAIKEALKNNAGLPRELQLQIDAQAASEQHHNMEAAQVYTSLFTFYPNEPQYVLLAAAQMVQAGQSAKAVEILKPLVAHPEQSGWIEAEAEGILSDCYTHLGDYRQALEWARKGEAISQQRGAMVLYGRLLTTETQALMRLHEPAETLSKTQEALAIAQRFGDFSGALRASNRLAQIYTEAGDLDKADALLQQTLSLEQHSGEQRRQLHTLNALGAISLKRKDFAAAKRYFVAGLAVATKVNQPERVLEAKLSIDALDWSASGSPVARRQLQQIVEDANAMGSHKIAAMAQSAMAAAPGSFPLFDK